MKALVLIVVLLCQIPISAAQAAAGKISVYSDPSWTSTVAYDAVPGSLTVYVVHDHWLGPTQGTSFTIASGGGFTGVWLGETSPHTTTLGTSQTGIDMLYGSCLFQPTLLLTITYQIFGTSATCSFLESAPHPGSPGGYIVVLDCSSGYHLMAESSRLTINPDSSCTPVPVETSSWGRIKALYTS